MWRHSFHSAIPSPPYYLLVYTKTFQKVSAPIIQCFYDPNQFIEKKWFQFGKVFLFEIELAQIDNKKAIERIRPTHSPMTLLTFY